MAEEVKLDGWKQIADYLRVSLRTAQYAEHDGLPVHRSSSKPKSQVWAYASELDGWKNRATMPQGVPAISNHDRVNRAIDHGRLRQLSILGVLLLFGLSVAMVAVLRARPTTASDFRVSKHQLTALDHNGRQRWSYQFPFQVRDIYGSGLLTRRRSEFVDIDGDKKEELVLQVTPIDHERLGTFLYCFSPSGKLNWYHRPGRSVANGRGSFSDVYWHAGFTLVQLAADRRVVSVSNHSVHYPSQVEAIDETGKLVGEYWHNGHLRHIAAADLDHDGVAEIVLGGADAAFGAATLVILDPRRISGTSAAPAGDWHALKGMLPAKEKAVILFPSSCVGKDHEFTIVSQVRITDNFISVIVQQDVDESVPYYLIFDFDWGLRLVNITPSDTMAARHRQLEEQGKLTHPFSIQEIDELKARVIVRMAK